MIVFYTGTEQTRYTPQKGYNHAHYIHCNLDRHGSMSIHYRCNLQLRKRITMHYKVMLYWSHNNSYSRATYNPITQRHGVNTPKTRTNAIFTWDEAMMIRSYWLQNPTYGQLMVARAEIDSVA